MISIIIRTKNEERWITQLLKSIFNQDYKDFEIIIVDNKSTDLTLEKAKTSYKQVEEIYGNALKMWNTKKRLTALSDWKLRLACR